MIDGDYYRSSANETVKASKLPWELIQVQKPQSPCEITLGIPMDS